MQSCLPIDWIEILNEIVSFYKLLFSDWLELVKVAISIVALIFAGIGLNTWKKQLEGTRLFDVENKLTASINRIGRYVEMIKEFAEFDETNNIFKLLNPELFKHVITEKYLEGYRKEIDNLANIMVEEKKWIKNADYDLLICIETNSNQLLNIIEALINGDFPKDNMRGKTREIVKIKTNIEDNIILNITKFNQRNSR